MVVVVFIIVYLVSFIILLISHYGENKHQIVYVKDLMKSIRHEVYIWFPIFNTLALIGIVVLSVAWILWKLFKLDILWEKFRNIKLKK